MSKIKVVHLSSAHPDGDVRIFHKECASLATQFNDEHFAFDVHLILSGVEERVEKNVTIHSVPYHNKSRKKRMWTTVNEVYSKALEVNGDIYHLHDPELLRIALKLKKKGKKVIYDAHEDLPRQILGKSYLKFNRLVSNIVERYEDRVVRQLDAVFCATPFIRDRFLKVNPNTVDINNFPLNSEIELVEGDPVKENKVCFIGNISPIRGIAQLVDAMQYTDARLDLAGGISESFKSHLIQSPGWKGVNELGYIDRKTSLEVKKSSFAGIVTFLALPNHINAQPNKIFEYMASGLPVIGSDFPLWREILEDNECGICVDPENPEKIAEAINYLKDNPNKAREMGERGRKMVLSKYNWSAEEQKLFQAYIKVIKK